MPLSQAALLAALYLANPAIGLPQSISPVDSVAHVTVTDHVTQTEHLVVTETVCAVDDKTSASKIEIDIDINIHGANADIIVVDTLPGVPATPPGPPAPIGAPAPVEAQARPVANAHDAAEPSPIVLGSPDALGVQPEGPMYTLQPAVHWDHDLYDLENLKPVDSHCVYYSQDGVADPGSLHQFASMASNLSYPAIILEHSAYISGTSCRDDGLTITFSSEDAVNVCQETWPSELLIVTHTSGCFGSDGVGQGYFLSSSITWSGLDAVISAMEVAIEDAVSDIDLTWGSYVPDEPSGGGFGGGNGGSAGAPSPTSIKVGGDGGCGAPPGPTISGFPATDCGEDFDGRLNSILGYVSFAESDFAATLEEVAPGIQDTNPDDYDEIDITDGSRKRKVEARFFNPFKKLGQVVSEGISKGAAAVSSAVKATVNTVVEGGKQIVNAIADAADALTNPKIDKTFPVNLGPSKLVDSPFGQAFQLYKGEKANNAGAASGSIALYCVECGVTGKVHVGGQISFSLLGGGITKGTVGLDGTVKAGLFLGLAAEAEYKQKFKTPIASTGVPGLTIPNVITVGPVLKLDAELSVGIDAKGTILTGAAVTVPDFQATLDIVSGQSTVNFQPQFEKKFKADGEITASVGIGLPITVGVGLTIPPIKFDKLVSIINTPGVEVEAKYSFSNTDTELQCNNGIQYGISLYDELTYDLFGITQGQITKFTLPVVGDCEQLGPSPIGSGTTPPDETTPPDDTTTTPEDTNMPLDDTTTKPDDTTMAVDTTGVADMTGALGSDVQAPADATDASTDTSNRVRRQNLNDDSLGFDGGEGYAEGTGAYDENDEVTDAEYEQLNALADSVDNNIPNSDGSLYVQIIDETGKYSLSADENEGFGLVSVGAADAGVNFLSYDNVATSDDQDQAFHFFPEMMKALGVSRFGVADDEHWPNTADVISLAPINYDDSTATPGVYVAADTKGEYYYTVLCNLQDQDSKILLVSDPSDEGLEALRREDLRWIVMGGIVEDCFPIAFVSTGPGF